MKFGSCSDLLGQPDVLEHDKSCSGLFKRRGKTATVISAIMVVISGATLFFVVKEKEKEFHFLVFTACNVT